jgi:hypothetical protein
MAIKKKVVKKKSSAKKGKSVAAKKVAPKIKGKKDLKKKALVRRNAPMGVKIISILTYISAIFTLILGVALLAGAVGGTAALAFVGINNLSNLDLGPLTGALGGVVIGSLFIGALVVIVFGILIFFVARGLWKGENWARIVVFILLILGFIDSLFTLDIVSMVINALIGYYIWFSREVKSFFVRK